MPKIIKENNKKVTSKPRDQRPKCNCRQNTEYPMKGNCLVKDVVYKYGVIRPLPQKNVCWTCKGRMKEPFL